MHSRAAVAVPQKVSPIESPQAGAVLIIDDEAGIRESLQTLLELEGYRVEIAGDGEEGLARIATEPFETPCCWITRSPAATDSRSSPTCAIAIRSLPSS